MASNFTINEVIEKGRKLVGNNGLPLSFEFSVAGRSIPIQPWTFGVQQRTVRTDYPGGVQPTEQVLGWNFTPFTIQGNLNDKYNEPGFADDTRKKLELLVQRGNSVSITFNDINIRGIVTNVDFDWRRTWDVDYKITVSPHYRAFDEVSKPEKVPRRSLNAEQLLAEVQEIRSALADLRNPSALRAIRGELATLRGIANIIEGEITTNIINNIASMDQLIEEVSFSISNRFLNSTEQEPGGVLLHIASLFKSIATVGEALRTQTRSLSSATDLAYVTDAQAVMAYEFFVKETAYQARQAMKVGRRNSSEITARVKPGAKALYRPQAGESLYGISNRFYSNPHNWRAIADRNYLCDFNLTGTELLIIPDVQGQ